MQLNVQHNLTGQELHKAITGMAIGSGIETEVIDTLQKAMACDNTPKVPRTRAMKELYRQFQMEFQTAKTDIEQYAKEIMEFGEIKKRHKQP
jgi:hypothetical protein